MADSQAGPRLSEAGLVYDQTEMILLTAPWIRPEGENGEHQKHARMQQQPARRYHLLSTWTTYFGNGRTHVFLPQESRSGGPHYFTHASTQGCGAHNGDCKISGTSTRSDGKLHINCLELKAVIFALQHWAPLLQGHQVMVATASTKG